MKKIILAAMIALATSACTRIDTGEVGLRVNFDKTIEAQERVAGSFNQTFVGSIIKFPIREISLAVSDMHPPAADNSPMQDFDVSVVYNISPTSVSDLYTNQSRSFHAVSEEGDTLLMYSYLQTTVKNAVYKVAREYESMAMNDKRAEMEQKIGDVIRHTLEEKKMGSAINISQVQIKSIEPPQAVKNAAIRLVAAKAENQAKDVEVETAKKEAERIAALSANRDAIEYMNANAQMKIAEGIAEGKVHTIVVPYDFKGIVNVGSK